MQRLASENINSRDEYARIYKVREQKEVDWADARRWNKLLERYQGGWLVDLGCLDSQVPVMAKERYPDAVVAGMDFVHEVISENRRKHPQVDWVLGDVYQMPFADALFDYAVMGEVIEHLEDPSQAIRESVRILRPGGTFALSTPLNEAVEPGAVDLHRHLWSFTEEDIRKLLEPYGTVDIEVLRSQQEPEYKYAFPVQVAFLTKK